MSTSIDTFSQQKLKVSHAAHLLNASTRRNIGIQAIGGDTPIAHMANRYAVSRKFVYQQKDKALKAITQAFDNHHDNSSNKVLFHLPVTKAWLIQVVLALIFICRGSYQGVVDLPRKLFGFGFFNPSLPGGLLLLELFFDN